MPFLALEGSIELTVELFETPCSVATFATSALGAEFGDFGDAVSGVGIDEFALRLRG